MCECCGIPKRLTHAHERDAPAFVVGKTRCLARETLILSQQAFNNNGRDAKPKHEAIQWTIRAERK